MVTAYIGLGSNLGDRPGMLRMAVERMASEPGVHVVAVSEFRNTKPIGPAGQPDYLNAVARIVTDLPALVLLDVLQAIETSLGRVRQERWGARTVDLDILMYDNQTINHPRLKVPHPELPNRPFLQELCGTLIHG